MPAYDIVFLAPDGGDRVSVAVRFADDLDAIAGLWHAAGEEPMELRRDGRRIMRSPGAHVLAEPAAG